MPSSSTIDNAVIDLLIDNEIVKTALHNEHFTILHLGGTSFPAFGIFIALAVMHWGFGMDMYDGPYLVLLLVLLTLVIIMVGLYPWVNWMSSRRHRFISKMGVSIMIGNVAALFLNIWLGRPFEVTLLIFWFLFCIGPLWFFSLFYRRRYVISGIAALKGGPLKEGELIEMMVDRIAEGYND